MTTYSNSTWLDVLSMIDGAIARSEAELLDLPHVVHVYDRVLGTPCVLGPFPSPVAACAYAERFVREVLGPDDDRASLRVDVIALEPADDVPTPEPWHARWHPFRRGRRRPPRLDGTTRPVCDSIEQVTC